MSTQTQPNPLLTTKRLPDEYFEPLQPGEAAPLPPPEPLVKPDRLDQIARRVLPYVGVAFAAAWTASPLMIWSPIGTVGAIAAGAAVAVAGLATIALVSIIRSTEPARR